MQSSARQRITVIVLLAVILLAAGALRLIGISHGLPHVLGIDEGFEVHRALKLGAGTFDFDRIGKGGFYYLLFVEYGIYYVWLRLTGEVDSAQEFAAHFASDLTPFWLIGRITHALIAVLVVAWTYRLGRRAYGDAAGLIGAAAVAVSVLHVSRAHYIGVDLPMTLMCLITLELALDWANPDRPTRPLALGVAFGLAVLCKLPAALLALTVLLAAPLRHREQPWFRALLRPRVVVACLVALVVFVSGNPGVVVNLQEVFGRVVGRTLLGLDANSLDAVMVDGGGGTNLWLFYLRAIASGLGTPFAIVAGAGMILALYERSRADLLILIFVVPFYVVLSLAQSSHLFYPRYVMPLIPLLGLWGGRLLAAAARQLPASKLWRGVAMGSVTVALLAAPAAASIRWTMQQTRLDSRIAARRWIQETIPAGTSIFLQGNPIVDTAPNLTLPLRNTEANLERLLEVVRTQQPVKAEYMRLRHELAPGVPYDLHTARHFETVPTLSELRSAGVEYVALDLHEFSEAGLRGDVKHSSEVLASRTRLYDALRRNPSVELVYRTTPETDRLSGPGIEIYRLDDDLDELFAGR